MNLTFSIPDKLYYITNFLDYSTYKKLHYDIFKSKLINLNSTEKYFGEYLIHGYKNFVDSTSLDTNYLPIKKIKILLENNPFHRIKFKNFKIIIHSMKDGSGINWHTDKGHFYGITYYINRRWNPKFGGELLFADEDNKGFIPPVPNSLLIIKTPLQHKVAPVMKPLVPRKTIQIFDEIERKKNGKNC